MFNSKVGDVLVGVDFFDKHSRNFKFKINSVLDDSRSIKVSKL